MKHLRIILPTIFIFFLLFQGISRLLQYIETNNMPVLTTPQSLMLFPMTWHITPKVKYFTPLTNTQYNSVDWRVALYSFSPLLATIFIHLLISIFFYLFTRLRRLEKSFIFHAFSISILYAIIVSFVTHHFLGNFFYVSVFITQIFYVYHLHSIFELHLKSYIYFILILVAFLFSYFIAPSSSQKELQVFINIGIWNSFLLLYTVAQILIYIYKNYSALKSRQAETVSRVVLSIFLLANLIVILAFFVWLPLFKPVMLLSYNAILFIPSIYVMAFFWITIRYHLVFFDIPVERWFLRFVYFIFFSFTYWFSIGYVISEIPLLFNHKWIHLTIATFFLLIIDPIRTLFSFSVNYIFLLRRTNLESFLNRFTQEVQNTKTFLRFLNKTMQLVKEGLGVYNVKIILNQDTFPTIPSGNLDVMYLKGDHPIWSQTSMYRRKENFSYYSQVSVGPAGHFLQKLGGFLIMFFRRFKVALVIYDKQESGIFLSEDIKFLRRVLEYVEPILENYRYLNMTFKLRKREHLLEQASKIQKSIQPTFFEDENVKVFSSSKAFQKVSGDYLDFMPLGENLYLLFLGDVSGHGLGSGYIQAVIRSLIRGLLKNFREKTDITHIFNMVGRFLSDHYRGSDFMTLFGLTLTFEKKYRQKSLRMEYINAGQHSPYIYLKEQKKFISFTETQQVLGFFAQQYKSHTKQLQEDIRIFLYSDGAFEFFDKEGKLFGETKLKEWISQSIHLSAKEQIKFLQEKIYNNDNFEAYDDASILILETHLTGEPNKK